MDKVLLNMYEYGNHALSNDVPLVPMKCGIESYVEESMSRNEDGSSPSDGVGPKGNGFSPLYNTDGVSPSDGVGPSINGFSPSYSKDGVSPSVVGNKDGFSPSDGLSPSDIQDGISPSVNEYGTDGTIFIDEDW